MSVIWGHATGIIILFMMTIFIGIWIWAWLPRHNAEFNLLAQLPMEDQFRPHKPKEQATLGGSEEYSERDKAQGARSTANHSELPLQTDKNEDVL